MTLFLAARSSQNASYGGSISVTLPASIPTAVGDIGLNTAGSTGAIRVILNEIAELQFELNPPKVDGAGHMGFFSSVCAYDKGLVGNSCNPLILFLRLLILHDRGLLCWNCSLDGTFLSIQLVLFSIKPQFNSLQEWLLTCLYFLLRSINAADIHVIRIFRII